MSLSAVPSNAELSIWRPHPTTSPLGFGSLRLDPAFAGAPASGQWETSFSLTQFNMWNHTWHTFATHRGRNLYRQAVIDAELRDIENGFPQDEAYHLDVEGWRGDLVLSRGFTGGISATVRVPWIEIGRPHMDSMPEWFHEEFGLTSLEREVFPRDQTFIYIKDRENRHIVRGGQELNGRGIGDIAFGVGMPLRKRWGADQRAVLTVEAPTGNRGTLHGSGGWDAGVSWFAVWRGDRRDLKLAAGATLLRGGDFLGEKRSDVAHILLARPEVRSRDLGSDLCRASRRLTSLQRLRRDGRLSTALLSPRRHAQGRLEAMDRLRHWRRDETADRHRGRLELPSHGWVRLRTV